MKEHMRWIWLSMVLVFTVLLTACGGTTSPTTGPSATKPTPTTVTVTLTDFKIASDLTQFKDLEVGQTKTVDYTFQASALKGKWEFACHEPGHYEAGMKLAVSVGK